MQAGAAAEPVLVQEQADYCGLEVRLASAAWIRRNHEDARNAFRTFRDSSSTVARTRVICDSVDVSFGAYRQGTTA